MELPSVAARHSNVANFSRLNNIVESVHNFRNFDRIVESMALEYVNVVRLEALEAGIDGVEDVLAAQTVSIHVISCIRAFELRGVCTGVFLNRQTDLIPETAQLIATLQAKA